MVQKYNVYYYTGEILETNVLNWQTLTWNISDIVADEPFMNDKMFRIKCWQISFLEEPCSSLLSAMPTLKHNVTGMPAKAIEKNGSTYKNHLGGNILLHFYNLAVKIHITNKEIKTTLIDFAISLCTRPWDGGSMSSNFLNKQIENVLKSTKSFF